jgi:AcrR family transcriptional regulator
MTDMDFTEKQIQIIETAEKLFADKGFDGTSVREIAKEANVNLAMISYYFGSKEKLMEAIFNYRINSNWFMFKSLVDDKSISPKVKMEMVVDNMVEKVTERECFHRIMVRQQILSEDTLVTNLINESRSKNLKLIEEIVRQGQEQKIFRKKIDVPILVITLIGTLYQFINTQESYKQYHQLQHLETAAFHTHLKRVLKIHLKSLLKTILTNES